MKRLSRRERVLLWICLGVVGGFAALIFVIGPLMDSQYRLSSEIRQQTRKLDEAELAGRRLEALGRETKELETEIAGAVREGSDLGPLVLRELGIIASQLDLRFSSVHPLDPEEKQGLRRYPFQLELDAPFPEFTRFLFELETPEHSLFIERVDIGPAHREPGSVHAKVRVAAYGALTAEEEKQAREGDSRRPDHAS